MSGALLQLAALGSQDPYLTSNPEISLFKKNIQRYSNFSTGTIQINFDGNGVNFGTSQTATIDNSGDLIYKMTLVIKLEKNTSKTWGYVNRLGHAIIDNITINVSGTELDIQYGDFMYIYNELNRNDSHDDNFDIMIGNVSSMKNIDVEHEEYTLYIPLNFWFTKSTFLTFPVCAINNQNFQVKVTLNDAIDCINYKGTVEPTDLPNVISSYLLVDYVYLDVAEREKFMSVQHNYLIEQVQDLTDNINLQTSRVNLSFDKPCKYIIWATNLDRFYNRNKFLSFAFDNDFEKARNEFAKLVWLSTRNGLDMSDVNNPKIIFSSDFVNIGEIPEMVTSGNTILETLANKVKGIILFAENVNNKIQANATIDNVVLTENTITFEDMSKTIDEIKEGSNTTSEQTLFLDNHTLNIRDVFNYGNYINRTDNPIVSSALLLNGREKFQQRDSNYFNSIVPYYNFNNKPTDGINVYSFSLEPTNVEPTGTINFGMLNDNKELILNIGKENKINPTYFNNFYKSGRLRLFAYNYSLLTISPNLNTVTIT
tara:strand:+ start:20610 stop:22232 length:1623 start_codon:yes stop_codon:yes gene_type:complete